MASVTPKFIKDLIEEYKWRKAVKQDWRRHLKKQKEEKARGK